MGSVARRVFIAFDEWLGWAVCLYLYKTHDALFPYVLGVHLVATYLIAYGLHWRALAREGKSR